MKILFNAFIVLLSITSFAQTQGLSIEQAVDFALKNNTNLKSVSYEAESQNLLKKTSFDLPKTDVRLMYGKFNGYSNDNNITITQIIPFTAFGSQGSLNKSRAIAGELKKTATENDLIYQVKQTYYQLAFNYSMRDLLIKQDSIFEGFYRSASLRYRAGETNLLEQTTAEVQRNEIKNRLQQNEVEINMLRTQLKTLLNSESLVELKEKGLTELEFKKLGDTLGYLTNPSLGYARQQIEVANGERKVEAAKFVPDLLIGYFNQTLIGSINPENNQIATNANRFSGIEIGLAIPLWFAPHHARVRAAASHHLAIESTYKNLEASIEGELQQASQRYLKNKNSLNYYHTSALPNSDLILKQSQAAFKGGDIEYAEYLLGLRNALTIKESYLQSLNEYNQSIIYIEYLTGNK